MSAEAFNAVMRAELAGMRATLPEHIMDGLEDRLFIEVVCFYWWQRLASWLGVFV